MIRLSKAIESPTCEMIEKNSIVENQSYEFKTEIDIENDLRKSNFIDDVVAFLNTTPGYILIGVMEKKGQFVRFSPRSGDPDAVCRRLTQVIQDNIDPRPLNVSVEPLVVNDGFILNVAIGEHNRQPYQNRINGAFYIRSGAKNTPLLREEVRALFVEEDRYREDVKELMRREDERTATRNVMRRSVPTMHMAIIPREKYTNSLRRFQRQYAPPRSDLKMVPTFGDHNPRQVFHGCPGGSDNIDERQGISYDSRFFIGDDWSIYSQLNWPFHVNEGQGLIDLPGFGNNLRDFLNAIDEFNLLNGLRGPYCAIMAIRGLQHGKMSFFFPACNEIDNQPLIIDNISECADYWLDTIRRASRFG